jgi:hypothetical protein
MEHPIKSLPVLQRLSVKLIKCKEHVVEIKEVFSALMDQHRFPYENTCEYLFVTFLEYENNNPLEKHKRTNKLNFPRGIFPV